MSFLADATKCEKCGQPWSQGFEAIQNDADMNAIAAPHQEFCSIPVENLLRQGPTRPAIDCCALWKGHTPPEHLGDAAWSEK
jgi:hypothetical protein